jgi:hypothetical protein
MLISFIKVFPSCVQAAIHEVRAALRSEPPVAGDDVVVFVAADSAAARDAVRSALLPFVRAACLFGVSGRSLVRQVRVVSWEDPTVDVTSAAVIDLMLLAECDTLVLSSGSTFGFVPLPALVISA